MPKGRLSARERDDLDRIGAELGSRDEQVHALLVGHGGDAPARCLRCGQPLGRS